MSLSHTQPGPCDRLAQLAADFLAAPVAALIVRPGTSEILTVAGGGSRRETQVIAARLCRGASRDVGELRITAEDAPIRARQRKRTSIGIIRTSDCWPPIDSWESPTRPEAQLALIFGSGCTLAQGPLFAAPMPEDRFLQSIPPIGSASPAVVPRKAFDAERDAIDRMRVELDRRTRAALDI